MGSLFCYRPDFPCPGHLITCFIFYDLFIYFQIVFCDFHLEASFLVALVSIVLSFQQVERTDFIIFPLVSFRLRPLIFRKRGHNNLSNIVSFKGKKEKKRKNRSALRESSVFLPNGKMKCVSSYTCEP